jgi:protein SCO1/2
MTLARLHHLNQLPALLGLALSLSLFGASARAQSHDFVPPQPPTPEAPAEIRGLEVDEHLGDNIPPGITFKDSDGKTVRIGDYFTGERPIILAMVYYDCPLVCDVLMEKQTQCFNKMDFEIGKDFDVLWFSFDPLEGPELAAKKASLYFAQYSRADTPERQAALKQHWKLHTGDAAASASLAKAVGFKYRRMDSGEYSHPVATYVVSPTGKITRYIHGFLFEPRDIKLSLIDASEGKLVASIGDRLMAFCFMFDESKGKYTLQVFRVMQLAGLATVLVVGGVIGLLIARERIIRIRSTRSIERSDLPHSTGLVS